MNYWLVKSDPEDYSWDDLIRDSSTFWNGVRNFQARNHLKSMVNGDMILFYHSGGDKEVVGLARVIKESYPDHTADEEGWVMVDIETVKELKISVSLADVKGNGKLKEMVLVRNPRLSVQPVKKEEYDIILHMANSN